MCPLRAPGRARLTQPFIFFLMWLAVMSLAVVAPSPSRQWCQSHGGRSKLKGLQDSHHSRRPSNPRAAPGLRACARASARGRARKRASGTRSATRRGEWSQKLQRNPPQGSLAVHCATSRSARATPPRWKTMVQPFMRTRSHAAVAPMDGEGSAVHAPKVACRGCPKSKANPSCRQAKEMSGGPPTALASSQTC